MGGRAVEGTGLENRQGCKLLVGSNPTPSATYPFAIVRTHPRNSINTPLDILYRPPSSAMIHLSRMGSRMGCVEAVNGANDWKADGAGRFTGQAPRLLRRWRRHVSASERQRGEGLGRWRHTN